MASNLYVFKLDDSTKTFRVYDIIPNQGDELNGVKYAMMVGFHNLNIDGLTCCYRTSNDRNHDWYN